MLWPFFSTSLSNKDFRNAEKIKMKSWKFYHKTVNKIFSQFVLVKVFRVIVRLEVLASGSFFSCFFLFISERSLLKVFSSFLKSGWIRVSGKLLLIYREWLTLKLKKSYQNESIMKVTTLGHFSPRNLFPFISWWSKWFFSLEVMLFVLRKLLPPKLQVQFF